MARILVVDDIKEIRDFVQFVLTGEGHDVITAQDALEALEILDARRFDLGIFDIEMPYRNGFELAETLRNQLRFRLFPIIFQTARKEKRDVERAIKNRADSYLIKPVKKLRLIEAVNATLTKTPPQRHPRINVEETTLPPDAKLVKVIKSPLQILTLSDIGITARTKGEIENGDIFDLDSPIFAQMGIPALRLKVIHQKNIDDGYKELSLMFEGINRNILLKMRSWFLSQGFSTAA